MGFVADVYLVQALNHSHITINDSELGVLIVMSIIMVTSISALLANIFVYLPHIMRSYRTSCSLAMVIKHHLVVIESYDYQDNDQRQYDFMDNGDVDLHKIWYSLLSPELHPERRAWKYRHITNDDRFIISSDARIEDFTAEEELDCIMHIKEAIEKMMHDYTWRGWRPSMKPVSMKTMITDESLHQLLDTIIDDRRRLDDMGVDASALESLYQDVLDLLQGRASYDDARMQLLKDRIDDEHQRIMTWYHDVQAVNDQRKDLDIVSHQLQQTRMEAIHE